MSLFSDKKVEERPKNLLVLCVLSWVFIGFSLLSTSSSLLHGPLTKEEINENKADMLSLINEAERSGMEQVANFFAKVHHITEIYNRNHYAVYSVNVFVLLLGGVAVFCMYKAKKIGFHLYIIYSILSITQVYLFLSASEVPTISTIFGVLFSVFFIFLYSKYLNWMN